MSSITVEVDIDDVIWEMTTSEKEKLFRELIEDGYGPDPDPLEEVKLKDALQAETYSEEELVSLFEDMWNNRRFIDHKLVEELRAQLRDRNVL